jgi:uncharacterized protein
VEATEIIAAVAVGVAGGMLGGLVGVGGGVIFVPGLVLIFGLSQLGAEATSLLAVVFVGAVGAWRQREYGNLRVGDALHIGLLCPAGVLAGTVVANVVSERALELSFAAVMLFFAAQLARRALRQPSHGAGVSG